ncbi:YqgE/AlgH family protein [Aliidiomarina haloalkalitolerans]|uniref:UPF0301 protein CWE06_07110 n=1 Tax=Aliidiomarina haloalkalitolerans TaxID=859059 RepID=A0A432VTI4_9GAMM|nr:YqgE/AlgH family protein [Aliidiomarina haloalkalitolerans]RUO19801.1 YqgE/AlgH family protein [Aliidiomarina haloalkalitolerans]
MSDTPKKAPFHSLQNHFLIAMPGLNDPFFHHTVTYVCEHNEEGAMGLVINQPVGLTVASLLEQIEVEVTTTRSLEDIHVLTGGPVATDRGFVLHPPQEGWRSSLQLSDEIMITTSRDILESLGSDRAPQHFLLTLGYAGWDAGQLEEEIADNSWLTIPADADLLFHTPTAQRWEKAAERLGFDINQLSSEAGHA